MKHGKPKKPTFESKLASFETGSMTTLPMGSEVLRRLGWLYKAVSVDPARPNLTTPYQYNGFWYAADGFVAHRINAAKVPDLPKYPVLLHKFTSGVLGIATMASQGGRTEKNDLSSDTLKTFEKFFQVKPTLTFCISPKLLTRSLSEMKGQLIRFEIGKQGGPIVIKDDYEGQEAAIMPMYDSDKDLRAEEGIEKAIKVCQAVLEGKEINLNIKNYAREFLASAGAKSD